MKNQTNIFAAIDIGTVTTRLLIARVSDEDGVEEIVRKRQITHLGEGVDADKRLLPCAIKRTVAVIGEFKNCLTDYEEKIGEQIPLLCVATSTARDALNSDELCEQLANLGISLRIISGQEEAQFTFLGVSSDFASEALLVIDSGGGSTELISGESASRLDYVHSFDIGCKRVTDRFLCSDPPTKEELAQARSWIQDELDGEFNKLDDESLFTRHAIAVAGTATSLIAMKNQMEIYDRALIHKARINKAELESLLNKLASLPLEERCGVVGLEKDRAPVIVGGVLILHCFMQRAHLDSLTISERDILHGLVLSLASS